jgi:hypothetical protein
MWEGDFPPDGTERCGRCFKSVHFTWGLNPHSQSGALMQSFKEHECNPPTTIGGWLSRIFTGK